MKKSVILSILGLAAATVVSYGQGSVAFNTYVANNSNGIITTYGNGLSGGIGNTFTGELLWSLTNPNDAASTAATVAAGPSALMQLASAGGGAGGTGTFNSPSTVALGYITGSDMNLTAAQLGGATTIYCEMVAFNGTGWGSATTTYQGHSASFAVAVATGTTLATPDQIDAMAPFQVFQAVPEPATMALGGLGLASLLLFRRKQA